MALPNGGSSRKSLEDGEAIGTGTEFERFDTAGTHGRSRTNDHLPIDSYEVEGSEDENKGLLARHDVARVPPTAGVAIPQIEEDEGPVATIPPPLASAEKESPVTWRSLPRKDQLAILTFARLSEPLTQTSLQAYMFYQLKSFNPSASDATISQQAGILTGSFAAAQFLTAMMWGRIADAEWWFGFSNSFTQAMIFRSLGGALNGNIGVMRTMISEIIREKKYQSRAFLLMPMTFNVGVIVGRDIELQQAPRHPSPTTRKRKLPFRRIWTRNVLFTFLAHGLLAAHVGTFNSLWFVFLSTPRYDASSSASSSSSASLGLPPDYRPQPPFSFTGGLALPPPSIGFALAVIGVIGISLQIFLYPTLSTKLGTSKSYRLALLFFPLAYTLVPFLAQIPTRSKPPHQADGVLVWIGITSVLFVQVLARTFALPATIILINNCSPHPSVLSTIHGIGQSVSSGTRTIGPVLGGWLYGLGLSHGVVGAAWWGLAGVAICGAVAGRWVREGNGHEILLEGEENEEAKS
ncbi:hypothetical protein B0A49_09265 [Cryomyces minteri]|uniref:Major facilitator superfamily (MFS) profile domain-containing protein n=1 Tax=Cryomyces minteri TaxID=331657 RepID=A0A4U0WWA1_9PEZI|nr:hypothetical protein B0A49_09265 [Cryomyces minteri]